MTGTVIRVEPAMTAPQLVPYCVKNRRRPAATVYLSWSLMNVIAKMNSFHAVMKEKTLVATRPGATSGKSTLQNIWNQLAPSM